MRNVDKIRSMSDAELAEFLCAVSSYTSEYRCEECMASSYCKRDHQGFIDWLQEEYTGIEIKF